MEGEVALKWRFVSSNLNKISRAVLQLFRDLQDGLGVYAWLMLGLLMLATIVLGYLTMSRLLRKGKGGSSRRFLRDRRIISQYLERR